MRYNSGAAPSGNPAVRERFHIMKNIPTPTMAVTILAIVWYIIDIISKVIQLLR